MQVSSISALSPMVTPWKNGQTLSASNGRWTAYDVISDIDGICVRFVSHYSTKMIEFVDNEDGTWWLGALSAGHGSNSDMGGFAKLAETVGSPCRIRRSGGVPRVVNIENGLTLTVPN